MKRLAFSLKWRTALLISKIKFALQRIINPFIILAISLIFIKEKMWRIGKEKN